MLLKPSRLERQMARYAKRKTRQRVKASQQRALALADSQLRREAYARDGGRCRVSGVPLKLASDNPALVAHAHHVIFRSAQGARALWNICTVSPAVHERIHKHEIDVEGNANGTLVCRERNLETGRIVREWESEAP